MKERHILLQEIVKESGLNQEEFGTKIGIAINQRRGGYYELDGKERRWIGTILEEELQKGGSNNYRFNKPIRNSRTE